jgi:hypothetical protein
MKPVSPSQIDELILSSTPTHWAKVAFVIGRVDQALREDLLESIELDAIAERIGALIREGRLASQGNVKNWRYSEIRNPHLASSD